MIFPVEDPAVRAGQVGPVQVRVGRHPVMIGDGGVHLIREGVVDLGGDKGLGDRFSVGGGDAGRVVTREVVE